MTRTHRCDFTVHGADLAEVEKQASNWLWDYIGKASVQSIAPIEYRNIQPASIRMDGTVLVWSADVSTTLEVVE